MQVIEKINFLLEEKNISKKEFVAKLQSLSPKLYATGEVPSDPKQKDTIINLIVNILQ